MNGEGHDGCGAGPSAHARRHAGADRGGARPDGAASGPASGGGELPADDTKWLARMLAVIRERTGLDFSGYRVATLLRRVRNRMRRLNHLYSAAGQTMIVSGDDKTLERPRPMILDGLCHGRCGFTRADHDGAAFRRRR